VFHLPKGSREQTARRRGEIITACAELYEQSSFHDVTIKKIAEKTSFSRPAIYNYFVTIEEIFLGLLQREFEAWTADVAKISSSHESLTSRQFASELAHTIEPRRVMLRVQAMNLYEMEENSRPERLREFKRVFKGSMDAVDGCLRKFFPQMTAEDRVSFNYEFFPFLYGVYPYAEPTPKQCEAMDSIGMPHPSVTVYELVYRCLLRLLPQQ
jgi:AcrR family transcriptional regulator